MNFQQLQNKYIESRKEADFNTLYKYVLHYAKGSISSRLKKAGIYDEAKAEGFAVTATNNFMIMYRKPEWVCNHFNTRFGLSIRDVLYNKHRANDRFYYDHNTEMIGGDTTSKEKQEPVDIMILLEDDKDRTNILMAVYKARTFRGFVLTVCEIKGRSWVENNAVQVYTLYRCTRHG